MSRGFIWMLLVQAMTLVPFREANADGTISMIPPVSFARVDATVLPGAEDDPPVGPWRINTGADGRVYVSAPLDHRILVYGKDGTVLESIRFEGVPLSVDARADGTVLVLEERTASGFLIAPQSEGRRITPMLLPRHGPRTSALRFGPDDEPWAVRSGNKASSLAPGSGSKAAERGIPLTCSRRQCVTEVTGRHLGRVLCLPWTASLSASHEAGPGEKWVIRTTVELGALHLVGEDASGNAFVVVEELVSRAPIKVRRTVHVLRSGMPSDAWLVLPPPSPVPVAGEWAVTGDGRFLLLRVEEGGARILSWEAAP